MQDKFTFCQASTQPTTETGDEEIAAPLQAYVHISDPAGGWDTDKE